jgi:hypothetical protein
MNIQKLLGISSIKFTPDREVAKRPLYLVRIFDQTNHNKFLWVWVICHVNKKASRRDAFLFGYDV